MPGITLPQDQIEEIKRDAARMTSGAAKLTELYKRYKEIYFMTARDTPKGNNIDKNDWKVTISPSGRNAVTGMKRLLDTSEVHIKILDSDGNETADSNDIERGLLHILAQSGIYRRARIEKDLNLSAVLYGPTVLAAERVDDLIKVQKKPAHIARLEKIAKRTPFLFKAVNAEQSFSKWGEIGMLAHLRRYSLTGDVVEERWGVAGLGRNQSYWVNDWLDFENRVVWLDGRREVILASPHKMCSMNITARLAGGTSLFDNADEQLQSFLYAHTKGEWDRRENLFWTYLFTALYMQGLPGPLIGVDPESIAGQQTVEVNFTGGVRTIIGKIQPVNMPVVSSDVLQIKQMMDATNAESTIFRQTLGQNIESSTFSGLAMLSSAGQLPLEDPKEALTFTYRDMFDHILQRIKTEGIENNAIPPEIIPDEYEIEVTLEPKLPQDNLRNAQTATSLGDLVSDEWKQSNLLQIGDSQAMRKQVAREQMLKGMLAAMMQDQELMKQLIGMAIGQGPQQQPVTPTQPTEPAPLPEMMQPGQPNVESMPAAGPMPMPQEMMPQ